MTLRGLLARLFRIFSSPGRRDGRGFPCSWCLISSLKNECCRVRRSAILGSLWPEKVPSGGVYRTRALYALYKKGTLVL